MINSVSFRKDDVKFLIVIRCLNQIVSGFPSSAPPPPIPLTQIEMTDSFPLDFKHL